MTHKTKSSTDFMKSPIWARVIMTSGRPSDLNITDFMRLATRVLGLTRSDWFISLAKNKKYTVAYCANSRGPINTAATFTFGSLVRGNAIVFLTADLVREGIIPPE